MSLKNYKNIKLNVSLSGYNTFGIGGSADFLIEVNSKEELKNVIYLSNLNNIPYYILGSGTNVLVSDSGFSGLVIINNISEYVVNAEKGEILASSGVSMGVLTQKAKSSGLSGLEWATGLPGTLGGAIYGNAGCCGSDTSSVVSSVEVFDPLTLTFKTILNKDCNFSYRSSFFKNSNYIIVGAVLKLKKEDPVKVMNLMAENFLFRKKHQPLDKKTEGCVFKNIYLGEFDIFKDHILYKYPEFSAFMKKGFVPAGYLIDKANLKGFSIGGASVSERHANFIISKKGKTKASDIYMLIDEIKNKVYEKFDLKLEEEIRFLGF